MLLCLGIMEFFFLKTSKWRYEKKLLTGNDVIIGKSSYIIEFQSSFADTSTSDRNESRWHSTLITTAPKTRPILGFWYCFSSSKTTLKPYDFFFSIRQLELRGNRYPLTTCRNIYFKLCLKWGYIWKLIEFSTTSLMDELHHRNVSTPQKKGKRFPGWQQQSEPAGILFITSEAIKGNFITAIKCVPHQPEPEKQQQKCDGSAWVHFEQQEHRWWRMIKRWFSYLRLTTILIH